MKNIIKLSPGMKVEAREYVSGKWRPATVVSLTPPNLRVGAGAYLQWDDVNPSDMSKSQGGWQPDYCIRERAA